MAGAANLKITSELDKLIEICIIKSGFSGVICQLYSTDFFKKEVIYMELVKKGRKQGGWAKKFKCSGEGNEGGGCGAALLVSQTDLYQTSRDSHDETEFFLTFCCPECGVETDVDGVSVEPLGKRPSEKARKAIARNKRRSVTMQGKKIGVVLGSTNSHKLNAVRKACERLGMKASVSGVKTSSGQNEQPVGFEKTFAGALTRAQLARTQNADAITVGIESGIIEIGTFVFGGRKPLFVDMAVIVVITLDDRQIVTTSAGIVFPEDFVKIAERRGFKSTTVGSVIAETFGGDPADPHSIFTHGMVSRAMILTDALVVALGQMSRVDMRV